MRGENIKKVSDLFDKYKKRLVAPEASVINAFVEVVEDLLDLKIDPKQLKYNTSTKVLVMNLNSQLKTEIKINQKEIISHLKGRLGEKNAPNTLL